jgi:hypothetical protein
VSRSRFIAKTEYQLRKLIKKSIPESVWEKIRPPENNRNYQGVRLKFTMHRIHFGVHDAAHTKFAKQDLHLNKDTEKTRLRTYNVTSICNLALNLSDTSKKGSVVVAGVSFGTAALVMSEILVEKLKERTIYLVDPFQGVENSSNSESKRNYNLDPKFVVDRMPKELNVCVIKDFLTPEIVEPLGPLIFVHLNTTDIEAERAVIPTVYANLLRGGFIVFDLYGFLPVSDQVSIDRLLFSLGAESFECVTRQLIVYKP